MDPFINVIIICSAIFLICICYIILFDNKKEKIEINYSKICTFLLIIIILIILNYNGFFYKFKIITKDNIEKILISNKLTNEEKFIINYKYWLNDDEIYGKFLFQILK